MSYSYLGMDPDTQTAHTGQSQSHGLLDTLEGTPARALTCSQPSPHGIGVESRYSMDSTITPTTHLMETHPSTGETFKDTHPSTGETISGRRTVRKCTAYYGTHRNTILIVEPLK